MKRAIIKPDMCLNCFDCKLISLCEMGAIFREEPGEKPWIDLYKCSGCSKCKTKCAGSAIMMVTQPCSTHGKTTW